MRYQSYIHTQEMLTGLMYFLMMLGEKKAADYIGKVKEEFLRVHGKDLDV